MGTGGFTDEGLAALDAALARHTSTGAAPSPASSSNGSQGPRSMRCSASASADGAGLVLIGRPDGWYAAPPALPDVGASLVGRTRRTRG
jgi:hypothetical protein